MTSIGESIRPGAHLLTITEVAKALDFHRDTITRWRRIGVWVGEDAERRRVKLHCVKLGGTYRVPPAAVDQFLVETNGARRSEPTTKQFDPAQTAGYKAAMKTLTSQGYVGEPIADCKLQIAD